jgi:hypothetical protein
MNLDELLLAKLLKKKYPLISKDLENNMIGADCGSYDLCDIIGYLEKKPIFVDAFFIELEKHDDGISKDICISAAYSALDVLEQSMNK